jgi:predicted RNase H-like nuclease (RuvC/YqgF family)
MEQEPLMNLRPKTPEEKVLWLEFEKKQLEESNRNLNIEIGMLQSEIDELKDLMKTEEKSALILKNRKLKAELIDKENRIRDLKRENELFLQKVIKLQTP